VRQQGDASATAPDQLRIIAAAGRYRHLIQHPVSDIADARIIADLTRCLHEHRNQISEHSLTLYFAGQDGAGYAAFVDSPLPLDATEHHLLKLFCTNIAIYAKNVQLVSRLHDLAFINSLLGLPNRTAFIQHLDERIKARCPPVPASP
jgi:predicted signal transduction protein with EAL and GGDEF domain